VTGGTHGWPFGGNLLISRGRTRSVPTVGQSGSGVAAGQLGRQGGRVGADPFLGEQAVGDPVELVADVLDGAPRTGAPSW